MRSHVLLLLVMNYDDYFGIWDLTCRGETLQPQISNNLLHMFINWGKYLFILVSLLMILWLILLISLIVKKNKVILFLILMRLSAWLVSSLLLTPIVWVFQTCSTKHIFDHNYLWSAWPSTVSTWTWLWSSSTTSC